MTHTHVFKNMFCFSLLVLRGIESLLEIYYLFPGGLSKWKVWVEMKPPTAGVFFFSMFNHLPEGVADTLAPGLPFWAKQPPLGLSLS